jgi:acetamidase/formamidase
MRITLALLVSCVVASSAHGQGTSEVAGSWLLTADVYGTPAHDRLVLKAEGGKLTGTDGQSPLEGTIDGNRIHFTSKNDRSTDEYTGTVSGDTMSGTFVHSDKDNPPPETLKWSARRLPTRPPGPPTRHEFTPTAFEREFSSRTKPVLTIWPGDTVHTTTVDAGGADEKGTTRVLGGNPQTGPFFIETAMPGDVLAVRFDRIRLNRDYAVSDDAIVGRALGPQFAVKMKDTGKTVRWHLDREKGVATSQSPGDHLASFTVPLRPMLGCVGVAPGFGSAPFPTGDSGRFGGNMDLNEVVEGVTVYLPVSQPGALLYIGDGHAAQGDGELNGNALETSMEVEFTVNVVTSKSIMTPRIESPTDLMAIGLGGSIEDALRLAVASLGQWLEQDYALTPSEVAQVLGTSLELRINEVADRNAGVTGKLRKAALRPLGAPADTAKPPAP